MDGVAGVFARWDFRRGERAQGEGEADFCARGRSYVDRSGLFNAGLGGKKWWAIDLFEGDELDEVAFKELVREAVVYNKRR